MKYCSLLRSKFTKPACIILIGLSFFETSAFSASDPILDVAVSGGAGIVDKSKSLRMAKTVRLAPGTEEGTVLFRASNAITIPFNEEDPLFIQGPCTWMVRCKIKQAQSGDEGYMIAGRWGGRDNQRIMLLEVQGTGRPRFQVSSNGALDNRSMVALKAQVPEDGWVTIVGRFIPGSEMALQLFDDTGELVDSAVLSKEVPEALPNFPLPFSIGKAVPFDMEFSRFRAWDSALSDDDIKTAAAEK